MLALLAAAVGVVVFLVWPGAGLGLVWRSAPGGALKFRLRLGSPIPRLLGSDGTSLFGVVHIAGSSVSPYLLAHEVSHCLRARGHWWSYLALYMIDPKFRLSEEVACTQLGLIRQDNPFITSIASRVRGVPE